MLLSWFRLTLPIAAIFAFRMLGLFMLIPVFSIYGQQLQYASPILIGVALGAYGFSQGIMQMPFGILSDHFGRKKLLFIGLLIFALGSLLGSFTHSIYGIITARIIQGCGAIGSVLIALLADLVEDNNRSKAMAIIGMSIGISFALAMILSPIMAQHYGLSSIFQLTTIMALAGILIVNFFIPKVTAEKKPQSFAIKHLQESFYPRDLKRCHIGIFGQHFILTSSFFAIPLILKTINAPLTKFYLTLMLIAFIIMLPTIAICEKSNNRVPLFKFSILAVIIGQLLLLLVPHEIKFTWISLLIYFGAFNILEALFPSMIAKAANPALKGTATGIYSTMQFIGIFFGGICSGYCYQYLGINGIFAINALLSVSYFIYINRG